MPEADEASRPRSRPNWLVVGVSLAELTKAALWPLLALIVFISCSSEIRQVLAELPNVISRANVVSIGTLKVELQKQYGVEAPAQLKTSLDGISGEILSRLIHYSPDAISNVCRQKGLEADSDLEQAQVEALRLRGLLDVKPGTDLGPNDTHCLAVTVTAAGSQAQHFVTSLLSGAFSRNPQSPPAASP